MIVAANEQGLADTKHWLGKICEESIHATTREGGLKKQTPAHFHIINFDLDGRDHPSKTRYPKLRLRILKGRSVVGNLCESACFSKDLSLIACQALKISKDIKND